MHKTVSESESKLIRRQRAAIQTLFVFVNLVLIDTRLPGVIWVVVGGIFWATVIMVTIANGPVVCSWICWLGTAQDWAEPLAKRRFKLNPNFWRLITLAVAVLWAPFAWLIRPEIAGSIVAPFGISYDTLDAHLLQLGFFIAVGLSVAVFGKRGACVYFCPLLLVSRVSRARNYLTSLRLEKFFGKPVIRNLAPPAAGSPVSSSGGAAK